MKEQSKKIRSVSFMICGIIASILLLSFLVVFSINFIDTISTPHKEILCISIPKGRYLSWEELDKKPDDLFLSYSANVWFRDCFKRSSVRRLKQYMKKNDLLIPPGKYMIHTYNSVDILRIFNFVDADTLEPVEFSP